MGYLERYRGVSERLARRTSAAGIERGLSTLAGSKPGRSPDSHARWWDEADDSVTQSREARQDGQAWKRAIQKEGLAPET